MGIRIMRQDMRTTHEEADVIMTSQALQIALEKTPVTVVSDDTDVFLLLLHFTDSNNIDTPVYMEATKGERTVIDIIETKAKHSSLCSRLLAAHALTGCDTVSKMHGIGKLTALSTLDKGMQLNLLGSLDSSMDDIIKQSGSFILSCYVRDPSTPMGQARYAAWLAKTGNKKGKKSAQSKYSTSNVRSSTRAHQKSAHPSCYLERFTFGKPSAVGPKTPWMDRGYLHEVSCASYSSRRCCKNDT